MSKLQELQARAKKEDSRPKESSDVIAVNAHAITAERRPGPNAAKDGAGFLQSFLNATPFFDLFEYTADHTYGGDNMHIKITKQKSVHPWFYQICQWCDFAIRLAVVAILIILATKAAFKVIN